MLMQNLAAMRSRKLTGEYGVVGIAKSNAGASRLTSYFIATTIFTSNFIGVAFARTLHYQFYVWYFHTLPYLLWHARVIPLAVKILVLLVVEVAFNVHPATPWSSAMLQVAHFILLVGLYVSPAPRATEALEDDDSNVSEATKKKH
jgi:alpha-1,3-mannosyltransferase